MKIAIAGIHTGIGKTIASAVIAEALGADYWKPVQAGLEERDVVQLRSLLSNGGQRVHEEVVFLSQPISPHAAAAVDGIDIDYAKFTWPNTDKLLIVETAGGVLSPMTATKTMADFIKDSGMPALLVAQNYLGSINHTLMSIEALKSRGIRLLGIVMNGHENKSSEDFIQQYSGVPVIARVPHFEKIQNEEIARAAMGVRSSLSKLLPGKGE
jgi:dethiobiotin synthetase